MQDKNKDTNKKVTQYRLVRHKWPDEIKQEKQARNKKILVISLLIVSFFSGFFVHFMTQENSFSSSDSNKLNEVYSIMKNEWYFGKDIENLDQVLLDKAIFGMTTNEIDLHTDYMDPQEFEKFSVSLQGEFVGIGIQYYATSEDTAVVERVFKGSGAEKGGMMKGDVIIAVDGLSVKGKTLDDISKLIRGEEGTLVNIKVLRENEEKELTIERSIINDSVYGYEKDKTGILEINSFSETSGFETGKYLDSFKGQGMENLIIDLRNNGGGYVTAAIQIASYFVPEDSIVYKELNRNGKVKEVASYKNKDYPKYTFDQIIILVNRHTASASEVLTSALKAHLNNITIIGEKTYGKGTVQVPHTFKDGSSLKYTIAEWLTPKGEHINGKGILPDIEVHLPEAMNVAIPNLEEDIIVKPDTVSIYAKLVQTYLKFLNFSVDRSDEYFSLTSSNLLKQYQSQHNLPSTGFIDKKTIQSLMSSCSLYWHQNQTTLDTQMNKAFEVLK